MLLVSGTLSGHNMDEQDLKVAKMNTELLDMMEKWAMEECPAAQIAAVLTLMGLRIYRSTLSAEDYHSMVDSISLLRDKVQSFDLEAAKRNLN